MTASALGTFNYTVTASNTNGAASVTASATIQVVPVSPTITTQPSNQSVMAGQQATFTVVAAGTSPLTYQWKKNGVAITGATADTFTTPATALSDSGSQFTVTVTNAGGSATSNVATLTVTAIPVPTVTLTASKTTATQGDTITLTWTSTNATSLTASGAWSGSKATSGSEQVTLTSATSPLTYILTASDGTLTASAQVAITVNPATSTPVYVAIPDVNFQNALIAQGVPITNGEVLTSDAQKVTQIIITSNLGIQSIQGIEAFTNLTKLQINHNQLTSSPELSHNTALTWLDFWDCGLTSLDVTKLVNLTLLGISMNDIHTIDLSQNVALIELDAQHANALDDPNTPWGVTKGLTSLDITKNVNLVRIYLDANRISSIDLSQNVQLQEFWAITGHFTSLDFSNNHSLNRIAVQGNLLTYLNLKGTGVIPHMWTRQNATWDPTVFYGNPNLTQIWVDDVAAVQAYMATAPAGIIYWWMDPWTQLVQ